MSHNNMRRQVKNSKAVLTVRRFFISSVTCPHSGLIALKFQKHVMSPGVIPR